MRYNMYVCDVCGDEYKGRPAADAGFDPELRQVDGQLVWHDEETQTSMDVEWPYEETAVDLCPEHAAAVAACIRDLRVEENEGQDDD